LLEQIGANEAIVIIATLAPAIFGLQRPPIQSPSWQANKRGRRILRALSPRKASNKAPLGHQSPSDTFDPNGCDGCKDIHHFLTDPNYRGDEQNPVYD